MQLPPLTRGLLQRRYKRFLAEVELESGECVTAWVPNTGSLLGCMERGETVFLRKAKAKSKLQYALVLTISNGSYVCVDTMMANELVREHALAQKLPALAGYKEYLSEVSAGDSTRFDLCCRIHEDDMLRRCWVEVKSTTLIRGEMAQFPDSVTKRGARHLQKLRAMVERGDEALQVYVVQREDARMFSPAEDLDQNYAAALRQATSSGVQVLALQASVTPQAILLSRQIPVVI